MTRYLMVLLAISAACAKTKPPEHASSTDDSGSEAATTLTHEESPHTAASTTVATPLVGPDVSLPESEAITPLDEQHTDSQTNQAAASAVPATARAADEAPDAASTSRKNNQRRESAKRAQTPTPADTSPQPSAATSTPAEAATQAREFRADRQEMVRAEPPTSTSERALTAMDQGSSSEDIETTRRIRQALVRHDKVNFLGRNVKIITIAGKVALRGQVGSSEERAVIEEIARRNAGSASVDSQLQVATR